jgi:DedD protein
VPAAKVEPKPESKPEPKAEAKAEPKPEARPVAVAKPADAASKPVVDGAGRFVVQVGAFAETSATREARTKVEKLGLATYTQVVETPDGKRTRVRVGPFASREEADKAAARLKAAGLPGAVLTL